MTTAETPLVGREAELDTLVAFLEDRDALPGGVVIEGPAGAGKTTLWRAAVERATEVGYTVLACRPAGAEVQLSMAGLSDLLEPHLEAVLPSLPAPQRRALEIALLLEEDGGQPPDQRALAAGVLTAIRTLAQARPVLIAIDDAQWADAPSAEVIEYALRRLGTAPVAVLASWRTESPGVAGSGSASGLRLERALDRAAARLGVGPLSLGALHRLLRTRTELRFNRRTLQRIHETSGGNPFYALELARAMEASQKAEPTEAVGASAGEPLALTTGLQELLADRLGGLDQATRDALFVVAAASHPTLELLGRVLEAPDGAEHAAAEAALEPAIRAAIVRIEGDSIEFVHPLLGAAAYAQVDPRDRPGWHARLAHASTDVEARARHLALAQPGPNAEVAASLHEAARHAQTRGASGTAAELFAEAIDRLPAQSTSARTSWTIEAGPILIVTGEDAKARELLEATIAVLPPGPERSDALLLMANVVQGDSGGGSRERELIEQALAEAGDDKRRRASALLDREMLERSSDRLAGALEFAREALALAEVAGDETVLAHALTRTADLEVVLGLGGEPVARFQRALAADAATHVDAASGAPSMLAVCLIRAGRIDEARPFLLECRRRAIAEGDEDARIQIALFLTELEWLAGNWDAAQAHAEEGYEVAEQAGARMRQGIMLSMQALLEASRGDPDAARALGVRGRDLLDDVGEIAYAIYARGVLGFLDLSLGNPAAAHEQLGNYSVERGIEGTKRLSFIPDEIEALTLLGEVERAEGLVKELERRGETLHRPTLVAAAARCGALVRGAQGDLDGALAAATDAVERYTQLQLPFERARSLLVLGEVQRRAKQRRAARETLVAAAEAFDALGARRWAARAEAEQARIGGRSTIEGLSATELRVAELVAEGRSNKEVAAELFVSVRAVESNLSKIYAKLGIRSRTELARRI